MTIWRVQRLINQLWFINPGLTLYLVGGIPTPLKNMKVSWDDDIPNWMESHKIHVPNHQPVLYRYNCSIASSTLSVSFGAGGQSTMGAKRLHEWLLRYARTLGGLMIGSGIKNINVSLRIYININISTYQHISIINISKPHHINISIYINKCEYISIYPIISIKEEICCSPRIT